MDQDNLRETATTSLVDAVRKVRIASADKSDVVVELREAAHTRLELLAQDLQEVIEDVPADDDRFDFALSSGLQPRFWIDATAHVMMGSDRRTYRFVRDTRLGRVVIAESADRAEIAESIVSYIAMRIHERELVLAGETVSYRELQTGRASGHATGGTGRADDGEADTRIDRAVAALRDDGADSGPAEAPSPRDAVKRHAPTARRQDKGATPVQTLRPRQGGLLRSIWNGLLWILLGAVIGGGALVYVFRDYLLQL